jgi:hypothetical protein
VSFAASASDAQDGNISASISWSSSLDGPIGLGASFSTSLLSVGTHVISASVVDAGGLPGSDSITIFVNPVGAPPDAPSNATATNNANRTATVRWFDNSDDETSFQIERQKRSRNGSWGSPAYFSVSPNATSYVDNSNTGTFRYRVRARNAAGDSEWSNYAEVVVTRR